MSQRSTELQVLKESAAVTAAFDTPKMFVGDKAEVLITINVSAWTSGTLTPVLEVSDDDGTTWFYHTNSWTKDSDGTTVTTLAAADKLVGKFTNLGKHIRVACAGSLNLTIKVAAQAKN